MMSEKIDILGLGYTAVDDLLYVDAYPAADSKVQIRRRERQCGGLTATALVAASRMGCRCAYAGTLGDDDYSQFVIEQLLAHDVDVSQLRHRSDARPVRSNIVVDSDRHTRTIFLDLQGVTGAEADWPPESVIRGAKALLVDNCGIAGMIRAAKLARDAGIPVVADFENADDPQFPTLLALVDHLILSHGFASRITGESDPSAAAWALWGPGRRTVAVTCGRNGCWYVSDGHAAAPCYEPALIVETVDTTGCGDVFHGVYAAALVFGHDIRLALRFASVAAGLKASCHGGQAGIPTRAAVEARLTQVVPSYQCNEAQQ
jgi:sulfofructose kinase